MPTSAKTRLVRQLERARALHEERAASPPLAAALDRLAAWQSLRLNATYADLARERRYARAIAFFQTDLYGPGDFSRRDADLARVVPLMVRVLPAGVIATVSGAMELSVVSHELDHALLGKLPPRAQLSVATYCDAYRALANRGARERQIALIVSVGRALDRYVGKPVVRSALAAMRQPARLAGLAALQDFLERGIEAFRHMNGAGEFLATVETRETAGCDLRRRSRAVSGADRPLSGTGRKRVVGPKFTRPGRRANKCAPTLCRTARPAPSGSLARSGL